MGYRNDCWFVNTLCILPDHICASITYGCDYSEQISILAWLFVTSLSLPSICEHLVEVAHKTVFQVLTAKMVVAGNNHISLV